MREGSAGLGMFYLVMEALDEFLSEELIWIRRQKYPAMIRIR